MTNEQLLASSVQEMKELVAAGGGEEEHIRADDLLCEMLIQLGCPELVAEFRKLKKWYA